MKSPTCKISQHHKQSAKQSSVANPQNFKCSQKGKSKAKKLKSQGKDVICQTSSSSFMCKSVKEQNEIYNNLSKDNAICDLALPRKVSLQEKNPKKHTFSHKPTFDSKPIGRKSSVSNPKETLINDSRLLFEHPSLSIKPTPTKKPRKRSKHLHIANQNVQIAHIKPAIIKMPKRNKKGRPKLNADLDKSIENVLGLGSPVQRSTGVHRSNDNNEKIDFLLNIIKSPPIIGRNASDLKKLNFSPKQSFRKPKSTCKMMDQSLLTTGEIKPKKNPQNAACQNENSKDFIQFGSIDRQSTGKIYKLSGSKFLFIMKPESIFYFVGVTEIQLLCGSVEILGYSMDKSKPKQIIYSLQGSSHLYVRASKEIGNTISNDEQSDAKTIANVLFSHSIDREVSRQILAEAKSKTIFILARVQSHISATVWPNFFECHSSFPLFQTQDTLKDVTREQHSVEFGLDCILDQSLQALGLKEFYSSPEWPETAKGIVTQDQPRTVLCGGKSVGKSSLLRYLVNKSFSKWDKVIVIDFDPGQCEFTLPGCISMTLVDKPLLGPNYTHLVEPLRSVFLGEMDVTKCPEPYIDGCKRLIDSAQQHFDYLPWFINTMGFTRGFGITLACGIISAVNPTHVLQIDSKDRKVNFPSTLEPGFVYSQNISSFKRQNSRLSYQLQVLHSGSERSANRSASHNSRGMSPLEARNLVILSYLSEMLNTEVSNLSQVIPHTVNISDLTLLTTSQCNLTKNQVAMSMNGNLVALCCLNVEDTFPNCLGFGIVRAIDWCTNTMYILTPMPADSLRKVNCVIKGSVSLPESLHLNQGEQIVGHVPYTAFTSSQATSRFAKRDFRSLPTTPRPAASRNN